MVPSSFRVSACTRAGVSTFRSIHKPHFRRYYSDQKPPSDPLRILFCGTDDFSIASLKALHHYSTSPQSNILSVDVVTKTDKRTGRGLKIIKPPAIKQAALDLKLPLHQIDTFTGWSPPEYGTAESPYINLIIAVSFGLLIPPRILKNSKYNGLNVHPSMLPDLRGPAPIQWTIMRGRSITGVSLQTLHPTKFDEGILLDQTPPPGLTISNPDEIVVTELFDLLAPIGAKMLVNAIHNRLYVPPWKPLHPHYADASHLTYAPKITSDLCAVDFETLSTIDILRRSRAIRPLYALAKFETASDRLSRINFGTNMRAATHEDIPTDLRDTVESIPKGVPYAIIGVKENINESTEPLIVNARAPGKGNRQIVIPTMTVSSMKTGPGAGAAARAKFFTTPTIIGEHQLYRFAHPLSVRMPPAAGSGMQLKQ